MYVRNQLLEAQKIWRLNKILCILLQQGAQNERQGSGGRQEGTRIRVLAFPPPNFPTAVWDLGTCACPNPFIV
jgi:hypothetical protein